MAIKYVLKWRSSDGTYGCGTPSFDRKALEAWAEKMNAKYPQINHWVTEKESDRP